MSGGTTNQSSPPAVSPAVPPPQPANGINDILLRLGITPDQAQNMYGQPPAGTPTAPAQLPPGLFQSIIHNLITSPKR